MKKEYTKFGEYFSSLRKARKSSITEAAKLLGVSIAYISSVEHGEREIPYAWIDKIAKAYNLSDQELEQLKKSYYDTPCNKKISLAEMEQGMINFIENLYVDDEEGKKIVLEDLKRRFEEFRN